MTTSLFPPDEVLERARIDPANVVVLDGRIPNWRVVVSDQPAVLKRDWHLDVSDIAWEYAFLTRRANFDLLRGRVLLAD